MLSQKVRTMQQTTGNQGIEQHMREQLELLHHHAVEQQHASAPGPSSDSRASSSHSPPPRAANGYEDLAAASRDAARPIAIKTEVEAHIHPDLRAISGHHHHGAPAANMMSAPPPPQAHSPCLSPAPGPAPGPPAPHGHGHAHAHGHTSVSAPLPVQPSDNSISLAPNPSVLSAAEQADGRKAKRELSQSKRAAQNRAAQRAFRQRKEGYIKKLEQQVRDYAEMEQSFKAMQSESYALREYVIHLQSRLIETTGEFPQPPPNITLSHPSAPPPQQSTPSGLEHDSSDHSTDTPLEAVAQAVAGLTAHQQQLGEQQQAAYAARGEEDTRTAEEINRQLQQDGNAVRQS